MPSQEDNERLCRVGPGTPTNSLMKQFWLPAYRSASIERDPAPLRILGENYIAFRLADGRLGLFDEACAHRGVSLAIRARRILLDWVRDHRNRKPLEMLSGKVEWSKIRAVLIRWKGKLWHAIDSFSLPAKLLLENLA